MDTASWLVAWFFAVALFYALRIEIQKNMIFVLIARLSPMNKDAVLKATREEAEERGQSSPTSISTAFYFALELAITLLISWLLLTFFLSK